MNPQPNGAAGSSSISIIGFVKAPGKYSYRQRMTVEDALDEAGGYEACDSCQTFFEDQRGHPTYDKPPKVRRAGQRLELPEQRAKWMSFILEAGDEIEFRHIDF